MLTQARESRDNPILNAFCRVAPSVRFNVLAILAACFFLLASDFNVRTCSGVHPRRFDTFLAIQITPGFKERRLCSWKFLQRKIKNTSARSLLITNEDSIAELCRHEHTAPGVSAHCVSAYCVSAHCMSAAVTTSGVAGG
jgi:hypothetical protein